MTQTASMEEFRRSLEQLVQQAQATAQLGFNVAKEQVDAAVKNVPGAPNLGNIQMPNLNVPNMPNMDQFQQPIDEVRKNLQSVARELETKAQELIHMASSFMTPGATAPKSNGATTPAPEAPAEHESATAAGAGTAQNGGDVHASTPTPNGEAPAQH